MKLLWNTNKNLPETTNLIEERTIFWGNYHYVNSYPWILNLLSKLEIEIINDTQHLDENESIIVVDHMISAKESFYFDLSNKVKKIYLIHLGDEGGAEKKDLVYSLCEHIWRTFSLPLYRDFKNVTSIPIGYKSGVLNKNKSSRNYKWAFVGTPHKSSRHDLLFQLSNVEPSFSHKTKKFNEKIMEVDEMSEILSSTIFIPCPNGFVHPETYRLYEALECECIPIVENSYKYYDRLFPGNPFIKIYKWQEAQNIIMTCRLGADF